PVRSDRHAVRAVRLVRPAGQRPPLVPAGQQPGGQPVAGPARSWPPAVAAATGRPRQGITALAPRAARSAGSRPPAPPGPGSPRAGWARLSPAGLRPPRSPYLDPLPD